MPMAAAHFMLTRKLLYTAVTRARSMLVLVGDRTAFVKSVANNRDKDRHTIRLWRNWFDRNIFYSEMIPVKSNFLSSS